MTKLLYLLFIPFILLSCQKEKIESPSHLSDDYSLVWNDEYIFYVDGKETWRTTEAVSHRTEYMILSAELSGWGGV